MHHHCLAALPSFHLLPQRSPISERNLFSLHKHLQLELLKFQPSLKLSSASLLSAPSFIALVPLIALSAWSAVRPLIALVALPSLIPLVPFVALIALIAFIALVALVSLVALITVNTVVHVIGARKPSPAPTAVATAVPRPHSAIRALRQATAYGHPISPLAPMLRHLISACR